MDAVINCNLGLINVDKDFPKYDFSGLHRSRDPGAGAFTPYHGCPTYTTNYVPAGGELFKDYGEDWFTSREAIFGLIPLTDDYPIAEEVVQSLHRILETRNVTTAARRDIWRLTTNSPWVEESRTLRAIPNAYENLELIATQGIRAAYQPQATRPIHELHEKGRCADAIRPQPSTLHQAGRGAFSTRPFLPNQIVTGTPMLFFPTAVNFEMYEGDWFTKSLEDFYPDSIQGYQLLYNYCWHPDKNISSIYMCPYGSGINYINHNQTRANVRLQWAPDGEMNHDASLLQSHPSKMYYQSAPRLWMDIVATREIADDEELFLDYGDAWERAWQDHANEWAEHEFPEDYESAHDWNLNNTATILKTLEEQKADPYPENFVLTCLPEIANWSMAEALTSNVARKLWEPSVVGFPCHVFERELQSNGDYWYRVAYRELEWPVPLTFHDTDTWDYSYWIIREAMRFQEAPYTSDIFLEEAFRHPMGFPDDVFPEAWRDVFLAPLPGMQPRVIV